LKGKFVPFYLLDKTFVLFTVHITDWFIFTGILFSKIFSLFESSEFDVIYENTTVGTVRDEHMTTVLPRNGSSTLKPPDVIHGYSWWWWFLASFSH